MRFYFFILSLFLFCQKSDACEWQANQVDYSIEAELKEDSQKILGNEIVSIQNRSCQSLDILYFHVYPNAFHWEMDGTYTEEARKTENPENHFLKYGQGAWMEIGTITHEGKDLRFSIEKELLKIQLPHPLAPRESIRLHIPFITKIAPIAERSGVWNGNYSIAQWFPKLMVYEAGGWALQHNAGYHFIGEFYGDFGNYDIALITAKKMVVGATGHKVSEEILADRERKKVRYQAENVHDFAWVADRNFIERTIAFGKTRIHVLTRHPESQIIGDYAQSAMEYFSQRIGEYPYADFTVAETYYNGPMEFPQIIFIKSWPSSFPRSFERDATSLLEMATVHETSHQWFYGAVGNNEVVNAWLDEGLATYFENSYMEDTHGKDHSILKFTNLLQLSDTQLSKIIWRLTELELTQPIQTPSYLFIDPNHYYASVYYKTWLFLRQYEHIIGREKFDLILRDYFKQNIFKNAEPSDWYKIIEMHGTHEHVEWFKNWINTLSRSDYAISEITSIALPDGSFEHQFTVSQLGNHLAPVDLQLEDENGTLYKKIVNFSAQERSVPQKIHTKAKLQHAEIDPEHYAPDIDRFNNTPGILPHIKVWPFTTKTIPSSSLALYPLPYVAKRAGIGFETGITTEISHYLDWLGNFTAARDWRHKSWNFDMDIETLQPNQSWGWAINYQRDVLVDQGSFMAKRSLGPEVGHDPSASLKLGILYFGNLGDKSTAYGLGGSYTYSNMENGQRFHYLGTISSTAAHDNFTSEEFNRSSLELRSNIRLDHWIKFDARGFLGYTAGKSGKSALFDLQAAEEGGMRFDDQNLKQFKNKIIKSTNFELQFPVPYTSFVDSLGFIHGPSWEFHLFSDISANYKDYHKFLVDAGLGTRFNFLDESFGRLGMNLELIPYQNVLEEKGFSSPAFLFNITCTK